jgi:hypothetical protein
VAETGDAPEGRSNVHGSSKWLLSVMVLLAAGVVATPVVAQKAMADDVKCGSPGWAPFRDAVVAYCKAHPKDGNCENAVSVFTKCKGSYEGIDEDSIGAIKAKDIAKGKVKYELPEPGDTDVFVHFVKDKKQGWIVQKTSTGAKK